MHTFHPGIQNKIIMDPTQVAEYASFPEFEWQQIMSENGFQIF